MDIVKMDNQLQYSREALCGLCGVDTISIGEWFIIHNDIWVAAGGKTAWTLGHEFLCIGCIEKRINRKLLPDDFTDCPLNWMPERWVDKQSERLLNRKQGLFQLNFYPKEKNNG